jgi:hypothetical protein
MRVRLHDPTRCIAHDRQIKPSHQLGKITGLTAIGSVQLFRFRLVAE